MSATFPSVTYVEGPDGARYVDGGDCVEQRHADGMIEVRDSKDPIGPVVCFRAAEYAAWLDGVRSASASGVTPGRTDGRGVAVGPRPQHARPT